MSSDTRFAIIIYSVLIFILYQLGSCFLKPFLSNKFEKDHSQFFNDYSYNLDSLKERLRYLEKADFQEQPKAKVVIYYVKEDNDISVDYNCNELLDEKYRAFKKEELKTIILVKSGENQVGTYSLGATAIQKYITLQYVNTESMKIIHESNILGGMPPTNVQRRRTEKEISGYPPSDKDIVSRIAAELKL